MPELPEVETTRRGIEPHVTGQTVSRIIIRQRQLRWPVHEALEEKLAGREILRLERRGKYLLFRLDSGALILHLGMSGSLRLSSADAPPRKHDHIDILFGSDGC
ncbi:MAG: DNA-formamidopyrimidine glycosylase, partial [Methylococcaceae bacterium]|nr:DNA-formamidopyrimidine glycosylase [Methylococcaceae bacterium]